MTQLATEKLVPNNTLITSTPEEGRALAINLARHSIHTLEKELDALMSSRGRYAREPFGLIEASQVVAMEFATIAAANNYWR
jgi:hypothetical protein